MAETPPFHPTYIRAWREARKMSLDELAYEANIDKGNLSKLERGVYQYRQETIEKIAKALGTSPADLIDRPPTESTPLWKTVAKAPDTVRRQIEAAAEAILKASRQD